VLVRGPRAAEPTASSTLLVPVDASPWCAAAAPVVEQWARTFEHAAAVVLALGAPDSWTDDDTDAVEDNARRVAATLRDHGVTVTLGAVRHTRPGGRHDRCGRSHW
jgi:hypothetical protein